MALQCLDTVTDGQPKYSEYEMESKRFSSFFTRTWPKEISPINCPQALAQAGFYYRGVDEEIACFFCGVIVEMSKLRPEDDPWEKHAWLSFHCGYVRQVKGKDFAPQHAQVLQKICL